jgi:hypothetical protein
MADLVTKKGCFDKLSRQRRCCLLRCYGGELGGVRVLPKDGTKDAQALAEWNKVKPSDLDAALAVLTQELAAANAAAGVATDEGDAAGDGGDAAVAEANVEDDVVDDEDDEDEDEDEDEEGEDDDDDDNMDDAEDKKEADADVGDEDVESNSEDEPDGDEDEDEDDGHEEDEDEVAIGQGSSHQCGQSGCVLFSCHPGLCIFGNLAPRKRGRPFG